MTPIRVVSETADAALLARPLRHPADIADIEAVPLQSRLGIADFCRRVDLGLAARPPHDAAILYVPDGDLDRPAETVSFARLRERIGRTARLLRALGIGPTDVVAVLLPNLPQTYWAILGAMRAGIVFPVNWMLEPPALAALLARSGAKAVIALGPTPGFRIWENLAQAAPDGTTLLSVTGPDGATLANDLDALLAQHDPLPGAVPEALRDGAEIGALVHSGGTTGAPKIVRLSHRNMSYRHWTLQLASRLTLGELHLHDTPMFHVGGLVGRCLPPLASGASMLIPSIWGARDKRYMANYWGFVAKYRVTRLSGVPTSLAVLAKAAPTNLDRSALEPYFITGSTALPAAVRDAFEQACGVRILNSYGMTENTASIAIDPRDGPRKDGSSGLPVPYTSVRAVRLNGGAPCDPNEIGMLQVHGPGLAAGYLDPQQARAARTADGWLITGDLGRIDPDGYVFVTGRAKDVIIRGGHNIDPGLIEEPLLRLPQVLHAAAVGRPDAYAGEVPVAYVQLVPGADTTAAALLATVAPLIAERAAVPREIFVLDPLPLSDVGKPLKATLRRDAAVRVFAALAQAVAPDAVVTMRDDALHGEVVSVRLDDEAARAAVAEALRAFPHHVAFERNNQGR